MNIMKVISITNQKGGVGKTTSAINIAYFIAKRGFRTLLVDFDPQGNATSGLGIDKNNLDFTMADVVSGEKQLGEIIIETEFSKLKIAPSTPILANAEVELASAKGRFTRLKDALKSVEADFDYVILDSPPSLSLLTVNGFIASDYLILPVQAEFYAMEGLGQLLESMKLVKKGMNPNLELLGVLPTMVDSRTTLGGQVLKKLKNSFQIRFFRMQFRGIFVLQKLQVTVFLSVFMIDLVRALVLIKQFRKRLFSV